MARLSIAEAFRRAFDLEAAGRQTEADAIYADILAAVPDHPGALLKLAQGDLRRGDHDRARERIVRGVAAARRHAMPATDLWLTLSRLERDRDDVDAAARAVDSALAEAPDHSAVLLEHALVLERQQRYADAAVAAERATQATDPSEAVWLHACRLAALARDYRATERIARAGLALHPRSAGLAYQLGIAQKGLGIAALACQALERASKLAPDDPAIMVALGAACIDAGRVTDAATHLSRAIALGAPGGEVWDNLGLARQALGDEEGAIEAFERAVALAPTLTPALANLMHARQQACAWDELDALHDRLVATLDDEGSDPRWPPFIALGMDLTPLQQLQIARRWNKAVLPAPSAPPPPHARGTRLRVGYLSSDFREHPTGRLMAALFEQHDRERFEIFGYAYGPDDGSELRRRIRNAFDVWRDFEGMSDGEAAKRIRDDRIDVLIDRKGLTHGARLEILASRPAPVQLHYMSFPGTLGFDAIDGLIADTEVIPEGEDAFYHERVWRLPRCYFVNDARREVPASDARERHGLPADALVLSCFNQAYKLTRRVFAVWLDALRARPRALLWLLAPGTVQQGNLRREAERGGVDPRRLVFAPKLPQPAHMARLACADLTLDTLPYNQHTTACDSLWAGVPMLTCRGSTFAGRVGASLLHAVELPQLVTHSLAEYRQRLLELLASEQELVRLRQHLVLSRHRLPLFDTAGFARDFEALLERAYEGTLATRATESPEAKLLQGDPATRAR